MPQDLPVNSDEREALADRLEAIRQEILSEWTTAIYEDKQIPNADRLTLAMLQDHFPEMFAEWRNGYRLDEVLRELARVREILLRRVIQFCEERRTAALRDEAEAKTRRFFDTIVATSVRQFMDEQQAEVLLRSQQLRRAYEQVQAATGQLQAVAQSRLRLLRGVSHELRNALHTVGLAAQDLLEEEEDESRRGLGVRLSTSALRLQRLLDRLQEYATILAGEARLERKRLDLPGFLADLEKTHRPAAESKGLEWICSGSGAPAIITTDRVKLRYIADILLTNAILYTEHGSVQVSVVADDPGRWILRVKDTGMGIDEASARLVFSEFHRGGGSEHPGMGLGLVIARHVAHLLDGEITFQSTPGEGSCFEVNLPVEASSSGVPPDLLADG